MEVMLYIMLKKIMHQTTILTPIALSTISGVFWELLLAVSSIHGNTSSRCVQPVVKIGNASGAS